jgi:hypothetical protein
MGFFANFKAKRAAKRANTVYQTEFLEWERENQVLAQALDIFTAASSGSQPDDQSLAQKKGELVLWTGNAVYSVAGRTPSTFSGGSQGFSIPIVAGIRYRVGSFKGQTIPGVEMQMDKDQGMVKLTTKDLSLPVPSQLPSGHLQNYSHLFQIQSEQISSLVFQIDKNHPALDFPPEDGYTFAHLFALGLYSYENGIPATIEAIQNELKEGATDKPKLELPASE